MNMVLAIFAGGGLGSLARHYAVTAAALRWGQAFPCGTVLVNVFGSFLIGALVEGLALKWQAPEEIRALLVTGFLGGFTTFSAFSLDTLKLVQANQFPQAALYVGLSVFLSLLAVFGGMHLMRGVLA
jgi:CrcB protein